MLASSFEGISAGFIGAGRSSPPDAIAAAADLGIDLSGHRSRLVTPDDIRTAELIVVMTAEQAAGVRARFAHMAPPVIVLGDLDPLPIAARAIRDPWNKPRHVFDECYARIDRCVGALAGLLAGFQ
jgi:protein-tyrosine-phosphatase